MGRCEPGVSACVCAPRPCIAGAPDYDENAHTDDENPAIRGLGGEDESYEAEVLAEAQAEAQDADLEAQGDALGIDEPRGPPELLDHGAVAEQGAGEPRQTLAEYVERGEADYAEAKEREAEEEAASQEAEAALVAEANALKDQLNLRSASVAPGAVLAVQLSRRGYHTGKVTAIHTRGPRADGYETHTVIATMNWDDGDTQHPQIALCGVDAVTAWVFVPSPVPPLAIRVGATKLRSLFINGAGGLDYLNFEAAFDHELDENGYLPSGIQRGGLLARPRPPPFYMTCCPSACRWAGLTP